MEEARERKDRPPVLLIVIIFTIALILYDGRYFDHVYYVTVLFISLWGLIVGSRELADGIGEWTLPQKAAHITGIGLFVFVIALFFYYFYRYVPPLANVLVIASAIFSAIVIYLEFFKSGADRSAERNG